MTNLEWLNERTRKRRSDTTARFFVGAVALWSTIASLLYLTRARWPEAAVTGVIAVVLGWSVWRAD